MATPILKINILRKESTFCVGLVDSKFVILEGREIIDFDEDKVQLLLC